MKLTTKKILSIILATLMLFSVMGVPASAAEETNKCTHTLNEADWVVVKEPTCHSSGIKRQWCKDCVEYVEETIDSDPTKHVPGLWEEIVPHTCTQEGREVIYCYYKCTQQVNGVNMLIELESRTVPAHDFSVIYGQDPDCMNGGYHVSMCETCGEMKYEEFEADKDAHKLGEWQITTEATCVEKSGVRTRYCLNYDSKGIVRCGYAETEAYTDLDNHKDITWFEEDSVRPTCEKNGYTPGVCNNEKCKAEVRKIIPRHSDAESKELYKIESTCHTHGVSRRRCLGTVVDGVRIPCGLEYDVELPLEPDKHVYTDWRITKEPGCIPGERTKSCIYEYTVTVKEKLPATGEHKFGEWTTLEEGTCSLTGLREKVCTICNGDAEGGRVTEVTSVKHDFAHWVTTVNMSCDETFLQQGEKVAYCNNCTYSKTFIVPATHSYGAWIVTVKPDCKNNKEGQKQRTCSSCGKVETEAIPVEHSFTEWAVADKPLCNGNKTGMYVRMCKTCGKTEQKGIASAHEFSEWEIIKQPVCGKKEEETVVGERIKTCKFCGLEVSESYTVDHVFGEMTVVEEMDCTNGKKGVGKMTCYTCGFEKTVEIPLHTYGNWYSADGASICYVQDAENVITLTHKCTKCGDEATASRDSLENKLHPNLKAIEYVAGCTTSGYTMEFCPDCGYSKRTSDIEPAKGHNLDKDWTTKLQATCNTPGSRYKACSECDYLEFQALSRIEHTLIRIEEGIEPTCTQEGLSGKSYCAVCLEVFESKVIPATGHKFAEGSEICSKCYAYSDSPDQSCACACHSTSGMEKIIFEIICKIYSFFGVNQYCKCGQMHYEEIGLFGKLFGTAGK